MAMNRDWCCDLCFRIAGMPAGEAGWSREMGQRPRAAEEKKTQGKRV
ncbi:MAG: hypothetical protein LUI13_09200 [Lachnospiraceae bacterium]|nr:hypothetical protein [Lachnospiraceae bacterium]